MNRFRKLIIAFVLLIVAAAVFMQTSFYLRLVQKIRGSSTVEEQIARYGPDARLRLKPLFEKAGVSYPPEKILLVAFKQERQLHLNTMDRNAKLKHIHTYPILAASGKSGPKLARGDMQVPEGIYKIVFLNPNSLYHLSMRLNYPNVFDRQMAKQDGRGGQDLGGDIMIHGNKVSAGCLAIGDRAIEELFTLVYDCGMADTSVLIAPNDLRTQAPPNSANLPDWTPGLYTTLQEELKQLPRQPGD